MSDQKKINGLQNIRNKKAASSLMERIRTLRAQSQNKQQNVKSTANNQGGISDTGKDDNLSVQEKNTQAAERVIAEIGEKYSKNVVSDNPDIQKILNRLKK